MRRQTEFTAKWFQGKKNSSDAFYVRTQVFIIEQGFSPEGEFDEIDKQSWHVVLYDGDEPVATGRTFLQDGVYQIGRICVAERYRRHHLGRRVMELLEEKIRSLGGDRAHLSAQMQAKGFYKKLGYQEQGEPYLDEHCPHIAMEKQLRP